MFMCFALVKILRKSGLIPEINSIFNVQNTKFSVYYIFSMGFEHVFLEILHTACNT